MSSSVKDKARLSQFPTFLRVLRYLKTSSQAVVSLLLHNARWGSSWFQATIKRWLGLDTFEGFQRVLCPGNAALDHLGHHAITCKYGCNVVSLVILGRYDWALSDFPQHSNSEKQFSIDHAMMGACPMVTCTTTLEILLSHCLWKLSHNVTTDPTLQPLSGETFP